MWDTNPQDTFETSTGSKISFVEYYKFQHGLTIKDVNQPLLLHRKSQKVAGKAEKEDKLLCLVPEFCNLTGLTQEMRSDFAVMKDVAQFTRVSPSQRMRALQLFLNNVRKSESAQKILTDWGLRIQNATIDLNARILGPETIYFGDGSYTCDSKNDWNSPLSRCKLTGPVDLVNWIVIHTERNKLLVNIIVKTFFICLFHFSLAREFSDAMIKLGPVMGCTIRPPKLHALMNDRTVTFTQACSQLIHNDVQVIVFL